MIGLEKQVLVLFFNGCLKQVLLYLFTCCIHTKKGLMILDFGPLFVRPEFFLLVDLRNPPTVIFQKVEKKF